MPQPNGGNALHSILFHNSGHHEPRVGKPVAQPLCLNIIRNGYRTITISG